MGWHMFEDYDYMDGSWTLFGGMFMLIFPILFVLLLVWLIYAVASKEGDNKHEKGNATDITKDRYARGEITKEEYEEIIKTLKK